jgi:hypothetical protein
LWPAVVAVAVHDDDDDTVDNFDDEDENGNARGTFANDDNRGNVK